MSIFYSVIFFFLFTQIAAAQDEWNIDPIHSYVGFEIGYMGIIDVHGKFTEVEALMKTKEPDFSDFQVNAKIAVASIETSSEKRDKHLMSNDFFDVKNHPFITFHSTSVKIAELDRTEQMILFGELTIKGITRKIELRGRVNPQAVNDPWGHLKLGCTFSTTINRRDYGLAYGQILETGIPTVADEVKIVLDIVMMKDR